MLDAYLLFYLDKMIFEYANYTKAHLERIRLFYSAQPYALSMYQIQTNENIN